jgi:DNA-binding transcriptional ArsR family regulator
MKKKKVDLEDLFELAEFFKIFGDSTRIRIIEFLRQGEQSVLVIANYLEMEQSAISHQLRILRMANLLTIRREGKTIYYRLDDEHVEKIFQLGLEHILHKRGK